MLLLEGFHLHAAGVRALLGRGDSTTVKLVDGALLAARIIGYLVAVFLVLSRGSRSARRSAGMPL
jgi:hypothetical protein